MSTTLETTPRSDVLSHVETRADGQPDICKKLARKVAVITGGSTGVGLATAQRFVQEGAEHVFITGRRKDVLDVAVAELCDKATGMLVGADGEDHEVDYGWIEPGAVVSEATAGPLARVSRFWEKPAL